MQNTLRKLFLVSAFFWFSGTLLALNPPPANDSAWGATDLGVLPLPPPCPSGGYGNAVTVTGSTIWASYNTFDFSPAHCFPSGSPDVWYRFTATSSLVSIDASGFNGLDTFFVKLFHSQGSTFSLVPLSCETSVFGFITIDFLTPDLGEEYYIQIGGNDYNKVGDFAMIIKSLNVCNECINESSIDLTPAPWFGRYGTSESVTMCYTVERWDYLGDANLHSIVPRFGPDWDTTTLVPISAPQSYSANNAWHWFTNVSTPDGPGNGYFFDPDNDGDPSNNLGDSAGVLDSWEACWKISSLPYCNTYDLSVNVNAYCDGQTGSASTLFPCNPSPVLHLGLSGWCCPQPILNVIAPTSCSGTSTVTILGVGNAGDLFTYTVYDTGYTVLANVQNVITYTILLPPGEYNIEAYNQNSTCIAYSTLVIPPLLTSEMSQTAIGCSSGTAEVIAEPLGGTGPYTYNFINHPTALQNDSLAFLVPDGWIVVVITDATGCSYTDSMWVISAPGPNATFDLPDQSFCANVDSILVSTLPDPNLGSFSLVSPLTAGITVNQNTGTIYLNNTTFTPPYYIYVRYSVGTLCQNSFIDSVLIVAPPLAPTATSQMNSIYCIGAPSPVLSVSVPGNAFATWYDVQTTATGFGNTYTTPLNGSTLPGTFLYSAISVLTTNFSCTSLPIFFSVNANPPPAIYTSTDTTICVGDLADVSVFGCPSCNFLWSPIPTSGSATSASFQTSPAVTTNYTVVVTDAGTGCFSTAFCNVLVDESGSCLLDVYHGITPNNDGHNDTWIIDGLDSLNAYVEIYNRWGQQVWQGDNYDNVNVVWRGENKNGQGLPDGTYYYLILIGDTHLNGWVELSH